MPRAGVRGLLAAFALAVVPFAALAVEPTPAPAKAADGESAASLLEFERRGLELYRADRTAWLTTDQLFEHGVISPEGELVDLVAEPLGWITVPTESPEIWQVVYLVKVDGTAVSIADGTVDFQHGQTASLRANRPPRALDAAELAQTNVLIDARLRPVQTCGSDPYNVVTLSDGNGGWLVYLMPPQKREGVFPMGGFHRLRYDADGTFAEAYAHTRSCLNFDMAQRPEDAIDAIVVSHLTSPTPNEIHVFMSLSYDMPVYVSTGGGMWKVEAGHITMTDMDTLE